MQSSASTELDNAAEMLRLLGYATLDSGVALDEIQGLRRQFDDLHSSVLSTHGEVALREIDEHHTIRCPLAHDRKFLELALNPRVLALCERLIGKGFILNQQNGIINPSHGETYAQDAWHRDLPYQHFVSSRPLALNALFCLDDFTAENGATLVLPASHKEEAMPSDATIRSTERAVTAVAGSFIILDCMTYHRGGCNRSDGPRRAVNHVFTIGLMRQQIDLPLFLGDRYAEEPAIRRLLGFDFRTPESTAAFYSERRRRKMGRPLA